MKTYAINLIVDTKNTDIYDKVALNKFPIVVYCKNESELKQNLSEKPEIIDYVKQVIKSQRVFDTAEWNVRSIYYTENDMYVRELVWKVSEMIQLNFDKTNNNEDKKKTS